MSSFFIANFFHHFLIWIVVSNMNITTRPVFSIELYQIHNAKWNRGWHNRQGIHLMLDEWKIMVDYLISQLSQKERIRTTKSLRNKQIRCHIQATVKRGQWISHGPRPYSNTWADVAPHGLICSYTLSGHFSNMKSVPFCLNLNSVRFEVYILSFYYVEFIPGNAALVLLSR